MRYLALAASGLLAATLFVSSLGCGGASNKNTVTLIPGGVGIGNLTVQVVMEPNTNQLVQGQLVRITFTLVDVNQGLVGAFLPISFEVLGGALPDPPTETDAMGKATVTFIADLDHLGFAVVRLIQPGQQLREDVSFSIFQPACILESKVDNNMVPERAYDACGGPAIAHERTVDDHVITYRVTRPDPGTGIVGPVAGAFISLELDGFAVSHLVIGPTNAAGEVSVNPEEHPSRTGEATVLASVVLADLNMDGVADSFSCNTCLLTFNIANPVCDAHMTALAPAYFDASGAMRAAPVRPGEWATVTGTVEVAGDPQVGEEILVSADNGTIADFPPGNPQPPPPGSALPIVVVTTNGTGMFRVAYRPDQGFSGTDTVTMQSDGMPLTCVLTSEIEVSTCGIDGMLEPPPTSGDTSTATLVILNVDPATAIGRTVGLSATGGFLSPPGTVSKMLVDLGGGDVGLMVDFVATIGYTGPASISVSFIDGYPCNTVTHGFTVSP